MSDTYWVEHCAKPRSRPAGYEWDVFVSYRSVDRVWAAALRDMLIQAGFRVFLDQFVLVPGGGLGSQLAANLQRSASGVLLWSSAASDSNWVQNEYDTMLSLAASSRGSKFPYYFVVAQIERGTPPNPGMGSIYIDFSEYPDGPTGAELVRLTHGLVGQPLHESAVKHILDFEKEVVKEPKQLRALKAAAEFDEIERRALSGALPYTTFPTLAALAADQLIAGRHYENALRVIERAKPRFPSSLRLQQLHGLTLRRLKRTREAIRELRVLYEDGHRDPETLGMLAACWADEWEKGRKAGTAGLPPEDALEHSRNLYREAFTLVPSDTYVGINAASKSALLGDLETAQQLAEQVLARLDELNQLRGRPSDDYWERATEAEAMLLLGDAAAALGLYHEARIAHLHELGNIESTWTQLRRLLEVLPLAEDMKQRFRHEFRSVAEGAA